MSWPYRINKKVGLFNFDVNKNEDTIAGGRIIGRKWVGYTYEYAVRLDSGRVRVCKHDELWTKWKTEKK